MAANEVRMLNDAAAYKTSVKAAPGWTMRPKLPSANDVQNRLQTEPAARGDLKKEFEATLSTQPCYSMGTREAGLLPPPKQPGPGQYTILGTLDKSHPTEVMSGRGFSWGTTGRASIAGPSKNTPCPQSYRVNSEPALKKPPQWSIGVKAKDPNSSGKEQRPDCQKYKVDKLDRNGPLFSPSWTLGARRSQISTARSTWPGPDKFKPDMEANGRRDRTAKWTFYHTDRFPREKKREPPY